MKDARDNKATAAEAFEMLRIAQVEADRTIKPMKSSAEHCCTEATRFYNDGMFGYAHEWAKRSLMYSVGIFHPVFAAA